MINSSFDNCYRYQELPYLPDEMWLKILHCLPLPAMCTMSLLGKKFYKLSGEPTLKFARLMNFCRLLSRLEGLTPQIKPLSGSSYSWKSIVKSDMVIFNGENQWKAAPETINDEAGWYWLLVHDHELSFYMNYLTDKLILIDHRAAAGMNRIDLSISVWTVYKCIPLSRNSFVMVTKEGEISLWELMIGVPQKKKSTRIFEAAAGQNRQLNFSVRLGNRLLLGGIGFKPQIYDLKKHTLKALQFLPDWSGSSVLANENAFFYFTKGDIKCFTLNEENNTLSKWEVSIGSGYIMKEVNDRWVFCRKFSGEFLILEAENGKPTIDGTIDVSYYFKRCRLCEDILAVWNSSGHVELLPICNQGISPPHLIQTKKKTYKINLKNFFNTPETIEINDLKLISAQLLMAVKVDDKPPCLLEFK